MPMSPGAGPARTSATRAAGRSGVEIRALTSVADSFACAALLAEIWRTGPGDPPLAPDVIRSFVDAGNPVTGAFSADRLLGACIGFWGPPDHPHLHGHIAGVRPEVRDRAVGLALKLDQRATALEHGVTAITWTFDPLVARNAYVNLHKLGGVADTYLVDHYGQLADQLNGAGPTDRLLLRWDLTADRVRQACDEERPGEPPGTVRVAVPHDIDELRRQDPPAAARWRLELRDALVPLLADGGRITGFDRATGAYAVETG